MWVRSPGATDVCQSMLVKEGRGGRQNYLRCLATAGVDARCDCVVLGRDSIAGRGGALL